MAGMRLQIERYRHEAEMPSSGYLPGELLAALDTKKLFLCVSAVEKVCINASLQGDIYGFWTMVADTPNGIIETDIISEEKIFFKAGAGITLERFSHNEHGHVLKISANGIHYTHNQPVASQSWHVIHNLGKYPAVSIRDTSGSEYEAEVVHIDQYSLIINFSAPFTGYADLN